MRNGIEVYGRVDGEDGAGVGGEGGAFGDVGGGEEEEEEAGEKGGWWWRRGGEGGWEGEGWEVGWGGGKRWGLLG